MCFWLLVSLLTAACCTFALKVFCVSCGFLQYVRFKQCWLAIYHLLGSVRRAAHYAACCVCVEAVAPLQLSGEAAGTLRIRAAGSNWMMRCYCAQVAELSASVWQNELSSGQSLPPTVTVQNSSFFIYDEVNSKPLYKKYNLLNVIVQHLLQWSRIVALEVLYLLPMGAW